MNAIQAVMQGAADWTLVCRGATSLFRGMLLFALGILLAAYVFHVYSSTNFFGGSPPGSAVLGFLAVVVGLVTLVGGPLLMLFGVFLLAAIPAAPGRDRWASWGVACVPALLLTILLAGWGIHQLSVPRVSVVEVPVQADLPPNASLWDSIAGPAGAQAQPAPQAPPLVKPRQLWGVDVDVILSYAAFIATVVAAFLWTLCIIRILRQAAQSWGDPALSRRLLIFFTVGWCIIAIWGALVGKWGFVDWEPALVQRISDACLPELTGTQVLCLAPGVLLGLFTWQMVLLHQLRRHLKRSQSGPVLEGGPA